MTYPYCYYIRLTDRWYFKPMVIQCNMLEKYIIFRCTCVMFYSENGLTFPMLHTFPMPYACQGEHTNHSTKSQCRKLAFHLLMLMWPIIMFPSNTPCSHAYTIPLCSNHPTRGGNCLSKLNNPISFIHNTMPQQRGKHTNH